MFSVPPVTAGLGQSSFTVVEGGVIDVCVIVENQRYQPVEVLVYIHIEGELKNVRLMGIVDSRRELLIQASGIHKCIGQLNTTIINFVKKSTHILPIAKCFSFSGL